MLETLSFAMGFESWDSGSAIWLVGTSCLIMADDKVTASITLRRGCTVMDHSLRISFSAVVVLKFSLFNNSI